MFHVIADALRATRRQATDETPHSRMPRQVLDAMQTQENVSPQPQGLACVYPLSSPGIDCDPAPPSRLLPFLSDTHRQENMSASSSRLARTILPRLPRQFPHRPPTRLPPFLPILCCEPTPFRRTPILLRNGDSYTKRTAKWDHLDLEDDFEAEKNAPTMVNWDNLAGAKPGPPTKV